MRLVPTLLSLPAIAGCALFLGGDTQRPILPPFPRTIQSAGTGTIECFHKDHSAGSPAKQCEKGIPVRIDFRLDEQGQRVCVAVLDYEILTVRTQAKRTKIVWEIDGPKGYEFATRDANGKPIDGVWFARRKNPTDPTKPDAIYDGFGMENGSDRRRYKAEVLPGAPEKKSFDHGANVVGPNGPCRPWDPVIINQDN